MCLRVRGRSSLLGGRFRGGCFELRDFFGQLIRGGLFPSSGFGRSRPSPRPLVAERGLQLPSPVPLGTTSSSSEPSWSSTSCVDAVLDEFVEPPTTETTITTATTIAVAAALTPVLHGLRQMRKRATGKHKSSDTTKNQVWSNHLRPAALTGADAAVFAHCEFETGGGGADSVKSHLAVGGNPPARLIWQIVEQPHTGASLTVAP